MKTICLLIIVLLTDCSKRENSSNSEPVEADDKLIFSDEFDVDGALDTGKWKLETIPPNNGSWWNGEKQHYTDRPDNVYISNGTLKIVAKKESYTFQGSTKSYTSARLNSKFSFTYGRVDVRAKLPSGEGTWPAIWTLGSNITDVGWPKCGEIDIMEHWGHDPTIVSSATHNPACFGGCPDVTVGKTIIDDFDTEFHVYSIIWNENEIRFLIDDIHKYTYSPTVKNADNWPYTADQFILLNVAMGGSWFSIDPNFQKAQMEIDYVRVYKN
ncbi:glycoside hydrolase family 16 protein [Seonamhaeicola sp.]|uniref:glycoside hydrolase family 16 protein n=1 Tax=Seonamhaeicola sp. TaxID=1912245 RepID=UPI002639EC7D|nr:glycoside hydrolase family 16 protein [Seonamhaeicola sp.]